MRILILLFLLNLTVSAQSEFKDFLNRVNASAENSAKQAIADSFFTHARTVGIPFIEDSIANFIYRGNVSSVAVPGDYNGWSTSSNKMVKLSGTNLFYLSIEFELNARIDYKFVTNNSNWILDPENPNLVYGGFGPNSELAMPKYEQPWEINYNSDIKHGTVFTTNINSAEVGKSYQLKIYLPPNYFDSTKQNYPVVYFQDGAEYVALASATTVLDNLIDGNKIQPLIGVFVKPNNRNDEYAFSLREKYSQFFVNELIPYIDSNYRTISSPEFRLIIGDSYGANISGYISLKHPEVFGNCGLQSAAFAPNNYEVYNGWLNSPNLGVKFVSVWGSYESLNANMINFKDEMLNRGYDFTWKYFPEGHSWGLWRATIDVILEDVFPSSLTEVQGNNYQTPNMFKLNQNYPNPFNPTTRIRYSVPSEETGQASLFPVTLKVYDVLGRVVTTLVNEPQVTGNYEVEFDASVNRQISSGIYFYRIEIGKFSRSKKMLLVK